MLRRHPLLDHAPPTPEAFAAVEADAARILRTDDDVVIVQAEAALALEAVLLGARAPGAPRAVPQLGRLRRLVRERAPQARRRGLDDRCRLARGRRRRVRRGGARARPCDRARRVRARRVAERQREPGGRDLPRRAGARRALPRRCRRLDRRAPARGLEVGDRRLHRRPAEGARGIVRHVARQRERASVAGDARQPDGASRLVPLAARLEGQLDRRRPHADPRHAGDRRDAARSRLPARACSTRASIR